LERDKIHFYLAVRSIVLSLDKGKTGIGRMNAQGAEYGGPSAESRWCGGIFKLGEDGAARWTLADGLLQIERSRLNKPGSAAANCLPRTSRFRGQQDRASTSPRIQALVEATTAQGDDRAGQ